MRGKVSNQRIDAGISQHALDLIKKKYSDFGSTLAHEKLTDIHKVKISQESGRKLMITEGLWKPGRAMKPTVHQARERRACLGELVQMDGPDHAWFEDREKDAPCWCTSMMERECCWNCCLLRMKAFLHTAKPSTIISSDMENRLPSTATSMVCFG